MACTPSPQKHLPGFDAMLDDEAAHSVCVCVCVCVCVTGLHFIMEIRS
jgi:hypothetical protein